MSGVVIGVAGGISSKTEMNAAGQWQLRLLSTTTGLLVTPIIINCIIGHLKGTVKTFHKGRLEWSYG